MARSDQYRQNELVVSATVLTVISSLCVAIRLILRGFVIRKPGFDDAFILGASLLTIGYLVCIYILRDNHVGFPITTLSPENMVNFMKATLAIEVMYYAIVACVKISILCMYLRIGISYASNNLLRYLIHGTIALHAVFFIVCMVTTLAQCQPLHKMWDFVGAVEGSCINTTAFFYFTSSFNILTDVWILALPIRTLLRINRPTNEKIALVAIFTTGGFATITAIIRLHSIYTYTEAEDPIRDGLLVNIWSMVEVNVGIMCASVPALKPLFTPHRLRELSQGSKASRHQQGHYTSAGTQERSRANTSHGHDEKYKDAETWEAHSMPSLPIQTNHGTRSTESTDTMVRR